MTGSHEVRGSIPLSSTVIGQRLVAHLACAIGCATVLILASGCSKDRWLHGDWLLVTEQGKPSLCHRFLATKRLEVSSTSSCTDEIDPILSGRWQLVDDKTIAVLRGNAPVASPTQLVLRDDRRLVVRGAIAGTLYRLGQSDAAALIAALRQSGDIRIPLLPPEWGCGLFDTRLTDIEALPVEEQPRMLRSKDVHSRYYRQDATQSASLSKAVFSVAFDHVEWLALHLSREAYRPPGPAGKLEALLGPPVKRTALAGPSAVQEIFMWRAYCTELRGAFHADVDVTLFSYATEQQGYLYLSQGIISNLWEDLAAAGQASSITDP